ncbi:MAG: hypothetical protein ABR976_21335 [Terracidiphilus sp.]|jgi:hypothetical protein
MAEMKPGDVRVFNGGKALAVAVGIWAKREREHLRIDITGSGGHTTISNNPASERYHRTLFRNMRRILIANAVWEFGEEGAETEERS